VDLPDATRVPTKQLARRVLDRAREHAQDLGSSDDLECVEDLIDNGNGGARQLIVYEANHDLREVMAEIIEKTTL
jgi:carboxylate-amine ligase